MDLLYQIFVDPFVQMGSQADLFVQTLWEGFVSGTLYSLIALGFVLIFKASGVFNFAQGVMVVFSALTLVGLFELGVPAYLALILTILVMGLLAYIVVRFVLQHMVNQPDIILFMSTIGIAFILVGVGQLLFGGENKAMITTELGLPTGSYDLQVVPEPAWPVVFQQIDIAAAVIGFVLIVTLALFFNKTKVGRALRAVADDHQAALSVGISLNYIWVVVWFAAGIVALATGILWGAKSDVSFALEVVALKALPVLVLGGFTSIPGAIIGGLIIGISEKVFDLYWGAPILGGGTENWFAYIVALIFLLFRPQGLFGEKLIERI